MTMMFVSHLRPATAE